MKYFSKILLIAFLVLGLTSCNEVLVPQGPAANEVPFKLTFSTADKVLQTKSMVSGTELTVHTMQLVCFDANGQYLGIRDAEVDSDGASGIFFDTGVINGTVPQGTARVHFIANRKLSIPLSFSNGTAEEAVMKSLELSTAYNDADHQEICFWGYHKEASAEAMNAWLKPAAGTNNVVYMIRDRARVVLSYNPAGAEYQITKIEWLIHNGRDRGYVAPAKEFWGNDSYYDANSSTGLIISKAGINEYKTSGRYSLWTSATENEEDNFDVAYQSSGSYTKKDQFLFDDDNADVDDVKVILRVTYIVSGSPKTVYHVLRLNDDTQQKYDVVRNHTYYINTKLMSPDVAYYETLEDAVNGEEFVNADVEVDRAIPDINNDTYTLQIKLPNEGTSVVLNTEGTHNLDFVFRMVSDITVSGSTDPADFDIYWEKEQTFCTDPTLSYIPAVKQFQIHTTVKAGQLTDELQDEWIVVEHKASGLKRYIHVYVIDQFRYVLNPTLKRAGTSDFVLSFTLPPMEHSQFLPDGSPDPTELIYPESLYPIDVKFTTNTLNAYGTALNIYNYGLFGVSVESTANLFQAADFEPGFNSPRSTSNTAQMNRWYFQQANNYWDFWYTYNLKTYPENGVVNIYFKDVRNHIQYATVTDVGLFLYVEFFGKNYSVPVTQ